MSSSSSPEDHAVRGFAPARRNSAAASTPVLPSGLARKGPAESASISDMIVSPTADERRAALLKTRARTFQLFDLATSEDVLHQAPLPGFRPVLWHLAHIGVFEDYWVLQRALGQASINERYDVL